MPLGSVADFLTENAEALTELSDGIWDTPELALHETKSSETLAAAGNREARAALRRRRLRSRLGGTVASPSGGTRRPRGRYACAGTTR